MTTLPSTSHSYLNIDRLLKKKPKSKKRFHAQVYQHTSIWKNDKERNPTKENTLSINQSHQDKREIPLKQSLHFWPTAPEFPAPPPITTPSYRPRHFSHSILQFIASSLYLSLSLSASSNSASSSSRRSTRFCRYRLAARVFLARFTATVSPGASSKIREGDAERGGIDEGVFVELELNPIAGVWGVRKGLDGGGVGSALVVGVMSVAFRFIGREKAVLGEADVVTPAVVGEAVAPPTEPPKSSLMFDIAGETSILPTWEPLR